jgi:hypothetical protein
VDLCVGICHVIQFLINGSKLSNRVKMAMGKKRISNCIFLTIQRDLLTTRDFDQALPLRGKNRN